jgi:hypothetical protein
LLTFFSLAGQGNPGSQIAWDVVSKLFVFVLITVILAPCRAAEMTVRGKVVDETNAPVAAARIRLSGNFPEIVADATGAFNLHLLAAGEYRIAAWHDGFFTLENYPVEIYPEHELVIVLNHKREVLESVKVTATPDTAVELERNYAAHSLSGTDILDLPFSQDRNLRNAFRLMPGVVQDRHGGLHFAGGAENQVLYTLDGFNVGDPTTGTFEARVSVDAVRSVEYSSGYLSPDAGKGSAGAVAIETNMGDDKLRHNATNFIPGVDFHRGIRMGALSPRLSLSGPLKRGRVWFTDNIDFQRFESIVDELPKGQDTSTTIRGSNLIRVQANLKPGNIFYGSFLANYQTTGNAGIGPLDPVSTTIDRRARSWFFSFKDQVYSGHGTLLEIGYAENRTLARLIPKGDAPYQFTPNGRAGNYFATSTQASHRRQLLSNLFLRPVVLLGHHQFRTGIDADTVRYGQDVHRTSYEQLNAAGVLVWRATFLGPSSLRVGNLEGSWYLMDGWALRTNVRAEYGVRADWDRLRGQWSNSPRASISYAPWRHTRVSAGFAASSDATNLQIFSQPFDQRLVTTSFAANGRQIGGPSVSSAYVADRGKLGASHYNNWTLGIDRRIARSLELTANLIRKRGSGGLTYVNTNANTFQLASFKRDVYDSAEIGIRHSLDSRHHWNISYTRSRTLSNAVAELNIDQTRIIGNNYGRMGWDVPNRLISSGYLPTGLKNWSIAYLLEFRSGFPYSIERPDGAFLGDLNSQRFPPFFELDFQPEFRFSLARKRLAVRAGFNNITNHNNPTTVNSFLGSANFLRFYGGDKRRFVVRVRALGRE